MSKTIGAEVPDSLAEDIEEYREEDESRSAAIRRLVRTGIEHEQKPNEDTDTDSSGVTDGDILLIVGVVLVGAFLSGGPHPVVAVLGGLAVAYGVLELETNLI
jgi:hypothetical protein